MQAITTRQAAAALLGAAAGMRTFTPPAALAVRGTLTADERIRRAVLLAAAGELIADKLPWVPARTEPLPLLGRMTSGALCGWRVAGAAGVAPGAGAAALSTLLAYRARAAATRVGGAPDLPVALLEDLIAVSAATLATVVARR